MNIIKNGINFIRAISNARLNALLRVHLHPINLVVSEGTYQYCYWRDLIFGRVSYLDAFSSYLIRT
jgi:hypothetical protein